jgi:6,7-dimethyl-8-ribityllumazine synthase
MTSAAKYTIVAAEFNRPIVDAMVEAALKEFEVLGLPRGRVVRVPGAYEIPLVAAHELAKANVAGLVALGYIERGETLHGEVMGHVVCRSLVEQQVAAMKPVGLGIIGPGATAEQAQVRHINCALAAVRALKQVADILQTPD